MCREKKLNKAWIEPKVYKLSERSCYLQNSRTNNEEPIYISYTYIYKTSIYHIIMYVDTNSI